MSHKFQNFTWETGPRHPILFQQEVHIWRIILPTTSEIEYSLSHNLSNDEHLRANKFYFEIDKKKFIIYRGALRNLLARYLGVLPNEIHFDYNKFGKPYLKEYNLYFNLSHSGDYAICAITKNNDIGIDVEIIKDDFDYLSIAKEFFSHHEYHQLLNTAENEQAFNFFQYWTRKEAILKAIGLGLSFPLNEIDTCLPQINIKIDQKHYFLYLKEIKLNKNYIATVAVCDEEKTIKLWDWN